MSEKDWHPLYPYHYEVGPGWHGLINQALSSVVEALQDAGIPLYDFYVDGIKEKYGGLRISLGAMDVSMYDIVMPIIEAAEDLSQTTCEICGAEGSLRNEGWLVTRCDKHAEENKISFETM